MSETTTAPAAPAPEAPAPAPAPPAPAPEQPATTEAPQWDGKVESLHPDVQKMIRDLRTESAERRTKLTAAEQAQQDAIRALAKAAGIDLPGEAPPDPAKLTEQVAERDARARQAELKLAVYQQAAAAGADPLRLLDSNGFLAAVKDIDPADGEAIKTAITEAVSKNTWLKAVQATGASSVDHSAGGPGEGAPRRTPSLEEALATRMASR